MVSGMPNPMMMSQPNNSSYLKNNFVRTGIKKIRSETKKENAKYDFLFNIDNSFLLMLSDMNPVRTKLLNEFDQQTQEYVKKVDNIIESSSKKISELNQIVNGIKDKLDNSLNKEIKKFIMELKDVSHKIKMINQLISDSNVEFEFYKKAVNDYEDVILKFKSNVRVDYQTPSQTLMNLIAFLQNRVQVFKFCVDDVLQTLSEMSDGEFQRHNTLTLYADLMVECEFSFSRLLEKANEVIRTVERIGGRTKKGYGYEEYEGRRMIEEEIERENNMNVVDKRLDRLITNSMNN